MNNDLPEGFPRPVSQEDALDYAHYFLATFVHFLHELGLKNDEHMHLLGHAYVDSLMVTWGYENMEERTCDIVSEIIDMYSRHRKLRDSIFNSLKKDVMNEYLKKEGLYKRHAES